MAPKARISEDKEHDKLRAMSEWWDSDERRWLRRHAIAAPFGILIATIILGYISAPALWGSRESLGSWSSLVDLGAVIYAAIAVSAERGVKVVFWALDERRKWREKWRTEAQAEGRAEGLAAGIAEGRAVGIAVGRVEGIAEGRVEGIAEGRVAGIAEGIAEGRTEALTALLEIGRAQGNTDIEELIARVAREKGISMNGDLEK